MALSQYGQATFTSLQTFLTGTTSSFLYDPAPTEMNWRSLFGALYAQDVIRMSPKLTLSLGFRGEFSTGWNEAHGRAANYTFTDGVISSQPRIASSAFTENNAKFLPQPRIGLRVESRIPDKTVVRAGFGIYNELQDALGYRMDQNAPFNPTYSIASLAGVEACRSTLRLRLPPRRLLVPGGVQPDVKMPTLISYSLRVEQELTPNTSLTLGYVGSHGYHRNHWHRWQHASPDDLSGVAVSGCLSGKFSRRAGGLAGSGRIVLHSCGDTEGESNPGQYVDLVFRRRQQLQRAAGRSESSLQP